ncbi:hypothetical protein C3E87_03270 [Tessaracoccus sp. ZS01]|nr:hypothetical protein [Tessaracoccus sp. ZS01]
MAAVGATPTNSALRHHLRRPRARGRHPPLETPLTPRIGQSPLKGASDRLRDRGIDTLPSIKAEQQN